MNKAQKLNFVWLLIFLARNAVVNGQYLSLEKPMECVQNTKSPSILDGILRAVTKHNVNSQCYLDMLHLKEGLQSRDTWALKGCDTL
jgi:hypothetical protein